MDCCQNGNALSISGTLKVAVTSLFLREGLRWCHAVFRDLRSLNHVLLGVIRAKIKNIFPSEKEREF